MKKKYFALLMVTCLIFLSASGVMYYKNSDDDLIKFPKGKSYEEVWLDVKEQENKGLPQTSLKLVEAIYEKAKEENNYAQIVKAIIHRQKYKLMVEEDATKTIIVDLRKEIDQAKYPLKPVLHSFLAQMYWMYYSENRWSFYNRTETVSFDQDDISTWDLKKIVDACIKNYGQSLENSDSLKRTPIGLYDDILDKSEYNRVYRPTLYDFLAHRAVDFFSDTETDLVRPADQFRIKGEEYFSPGHEFGKLKLETTDTMSLKFYAITMLQALTQFHAEDTNKDAFLEVELKRLKFVYQNSVESMKDTLFLRALEVLEKDNLKSVISTEFTYEIANIVYQRGLKYQPLISDDNKWLLKKAYQICEESVKRHPGSHGAYNCQYLQSQITAKSISLKFELFNQADKPSKALASYKNLDKLYFRAVKIDRKNHYNDIRQLYDNTLIEYLTNLKSVSTWEQKFEDDGDYQVHTSEIKIPSMEYGYYLILASYNPDFANDKNAIAYTYTSITSMAYIQRQKQDGSYDFYIMDRESGKPLANIKSILWLYDYDYNKQYYVYKKLSETVSDATGYLNLPPVENYRTFYVEFGNSKDKLFTNEAFYQYKPYVYDDSNTIIHFFTDRSIYRPGQTIFFKGIILHYKDKQYSIAPNYATTITFYDVNYQKISDLYLTSNEYGTISGSFTAPKGVLTGQMRIEGINSTHYFSVEEYKRPKFEVTFDPVEGSYRLGEEVSVKGKAKAYAGSVIDGAEVSYKVMRSTYFPYRGWWDWYYPSSSDESVVTFGTATTNEMGEFEVAFKALPDPATPKERNPTFNYTVSVDVTDINGETHSASQTVPVGYKSLMISTNLPEKINLDVLKDFELNSNNLNGEFLAAEGTIEIHKLKEHTSLYCPKKWQQADRHFIKKNEYDTLYPFESYSDETRIDKLEKESKVFSGVFNTAKDKKIILKGIGEWKQGIYILEIQSKDPYGEDVTYQQYLKVFSPKNKVPAIQSMNWFTTLKGKGEPGEKASFLVGSSDEDVQVLYEIEHQGNIAHSEWLTLSKEQRVVTIPIEEKHRGNFSVSFMFVKHNTVFSTTELVIVPYSNKELDIAFSTFRNKLYPGQDEEWKLTVKGKNGDKVAAEMVATLYDASLDAFKDHNWDFSIYPYNYSRLYWQSNGAFGTTDATVYQHYWYPNSYYNTKYYDRLNLFGFYYYNYYGYNKYNKSARYMMDGGSIEDNTTGAVEEIAMDEPDASPVTSTSGKKKAVDEKESSINSKDEVKGNPVQNQASIAVLGKEQTGEGEGVPVKARTNFNETAFFFPQLETNAEGEVIIKFTIPEALTRWKMMGFAHTRELMFGMIDNELVTQKDLMVMPNVPRFLRENDEITLSSKISNISEKDLSGTATLYLFDALTQKPIDKELFNITMNKPFEAKKGLSANVTWNIKIPTGVQAVTYRITAKSGNFSDGEENTIPVLTNSMLVTESMPLPIRSKETKDFHFEKLLKSGSSTTLRHHQVTLEFTANPAWYAVQALPYLIEYPYECTEQTFSRFYANSIASHISNSSPKICKVFDSWRDTPDSKTLLSNLEKNQELKSLLLEETPWVLDANDESTRKKRVGLLFDLNQMADNLNSALKKLEKMQVSNGGWTWFQGMPEDRYMTQHIITGFGHLKQLGVTDVRGDNQIWTMVSNGVNYLDNEMRKDYNWIKKNYTEKEMKENHLSGTQIQYLYARSYFKDEIEINRKDMEAFDYFRGQAETYWLANGQYLQGMIALALHRFGNETVPAAIIKSLKEHSLSSEEMGMYWKDNTWGYYWYQAPIETQALFIEAFDEITNDSVAVDNMRVWLLKQKQTQDWKTTKATTEAVYALLLRGNDWLATESNVEIKMAGKVIDPNAMPEVKVEAGTGYFKKTWFTDEIVPEMGNITVTKKDKGVSWGALYWQYFEQLDKITPHETPLKLQKKLFIEEMTPGGTVIRPIEKGEIKVGNKIIVRIELRVDRAMEYIHMKDMRASGFEPINVMSGYKYQGGLGYYESTRDVATNFFISYLPKGTFVFEYPLRASLAGDFSNGITTIQCMYAPEFTSHSEGIRVKIK